MTKLSKMPYATIACLIAIVNSAPFIETAAIKQAVPLDGNNDPCPFGLCLFDGTKVKWTKGTTKDEQLQQVDIPVEEEFDFDKPRIRVPRQGPISWGGSLGANVPGQGFFGPTFGGGVDRSTGVIEPWSTGLNIGNLFGAKFGPTFKIPVIGGK